MKKGENHKLLDQAGVENLVKQLYSLPHYGAQFRRIKEAVNESEVVITREKPYIMQAKSHWGQSDSAKRPKTLATVAVAGVNRERGFLESLRGWAARKLGWR
jgi:hypothetical protein